jgi:PAS domain S-box-containing protein
LAAEKAMLAEPMKILLVEDNPGDALLIREMLADAGRHTFALERVAKLTDGLALLARGEVDLILLDLDLPDSHGLDTFISVHHQAPDVPVVILTGLADDALAITAVREGAQDYLFKNEITPALLQRSMRYATERKHAELAVQAERKKLFSLLNSLPAFVHLLREDYTILFANRRFKDIFGDPGSSPCYEIIHGRSEPCIACQTAQIIATRTPQQLEVTFPCNGRTYEIYRYPFCTDEGILVLNLGIDITARKLGEREIERHQKELQIILDSVPALIFYKDLNNRFLRINKAMAELSGLKVEEIEGKTAFEIYPGQANDYWRDDLEVSSTGLPKMNIIECVETAKGQKWVQTDKLPCRDEHDEIIGVIGFSVEITKRRTAEQKLLESEKNLRYLATQLLTAQEVERKRISSELHDELGHALLTLRVYLKGIEKHLLPSQVSLKREMRPMLNYIDKVVSNVRRLYLDLSPGDLEDLGLTAAMQSLIDEFATGHKKIKWTVNLDNIDNLFSEHSQTTIIYRLLQEALTNIGKHAEPTKVSIRLKKGADNILFTIEDNGKGFDVAQIFSPAKGMQRLGLAAMQERSKMLGGSAEIWSRAQQGTRITLNIPIPEGGK